MLRPSRILNNKLYIFGAIWLLLFALYLPAVNAGFTGDFTGWLDEIRKDGFWEFISRKNFTEQSLYHVTQFSTYIFYKLFGANNWAWHILFVTMQAVNALLVFLVSKRIFEDSGIAKAGIVSFCGTVLFCVSPHITEIVIWEPAFHYLEGFLFMFLILLWAQKFLREPKVKYTWWVSILFFISTHSLEIFYLTPCLVFILILYYRYALGWDKTICKKAFYFLFIPLALLFIFYFVELRLVFGTWIAHIDAGARSEPIWNGLGKPAKYLIRIIFLERFLPEGIKNAIYAFCDSWTGIILFYGLVIAIFGLIVSKLRRMGPVFKATSLMFLCFIMTLCLMIPLWFEPLFITFGDRHAYVSFPFAYMLVALLLFSIPGRYAGASLLVIYTLVNARFTIKINRYWMKSARITYNLLHSFPDPGNRVTLLFGLPQTMQGAPMVCSSSEGEFKLMLRLFVPEKDYSGNEIFDVCSMNMVTPSDGVHVTVMNDSTLRVTANQWGTWWFYNGRGCVSYENKYYKLVVSDGHFYDITIRQKPEQYLSLFQTGGNWKVVDWNKKNTDQY